MARQLGDKMMLRLPTGLRDQVKIAAAINRRSMNSEVVFHLERALAGAQTATGASFAGATPAAASNTAACQGGNDINHG